MNGQTLYKFPNKIIFELMQFVILNWPPHMDSIDELD